MTRFNAFPDLEAVASQALRAAGYRAYSSVPSRPTWPLMVVERIGGTPAVREYLDSARIQVHVWGGQRDDPEPKVSKGEIHDIAQEARITLLELEGEMLDGPVEGYKVFISGVDDAMGLTWVPDDTGRDRYLFTMWLFGRMEETDEPEPEP